ncbi:hypothetical protein [Enhygromyxa salina]|uniref:Cytochrome c n=1 Tax=Enhygromyxa salina TaxID=215803 RepID=A0A2S9XQJ7_9BACT|nr:hypothetical protein [Enhygromyxa salina]PRP95126.1 Cytochrome c [Enhygromyxa salina]
MHVALETGRALACLGTLASLCATACSERPTPDPSSTASAPPAIALDDDPHAYITSAAYRRGILERDLVDPEPIYARVRLRHYSLDHARGWDRAPITDWSTLPLTREQAAQIAETKRLPRVEFGATLGAGFGTEQAPTGLPETREAWIALGERVFFEYPMGVAPVLGRALRDGVDLRDYGVLEGVLEHEGAYVGVRLAEHEGHTRIVTTCASCHASRGADGVVSGIRANREFDLARLRLEHGGAHEAQLVDATRAEDLHKLGPGRSDVQHDDVFNPYAFPDFGGIVDMPYLHHTANWYHRGVASLAIRVETVFMTHGRASARPPRVLMWALAEYLRSLPPPPPVAQPSAQSELGRQVFMAEGCDTCHTPPLYTSELRVSLDEMGTDRSAGDSPLRGTGYWRVPSLRGVGGNAPYLHHGAFATLEQMFDPARSEPGHRYALDLQPNERAQLLAFLHTI